MSRKRSTDKSIPISVALPGSLVRRLDQELKYTASRSKYVAKAIENRLQDMASSSTLEMPTSQLMGMLHARPDISPQLKQMLKILLSD